MKKVGIVGFGRFGELLASMATPYFDVHIVENDSNRAQAAADSGYKLISVDAESIAALEIIFLAVPISAFQQTLMTLAPFVGEYQVVIDLCSVKVYPVQLMKKYLAESGCQILGAHPMFGPDGAKKGLDGMRVALCPVRIEPANLQVIKDFWASHNLEAIETTPEEHDRDVAYSLAFTYSLARIIINMDLPRVTFETKNYAAIIEVAELSANDTEQLFHDMLFYNPFFSAMRSELKTSIKKTNTILAKIEAEQKKAIRDVVAKQKPIG